MVVFRHFYCRHFKIFVIMLLLGAIILLSLHQFTRGINKFPDFFRMVIQNCRRRLTIHYVIVLWDDWPILMISGSYEQLQQKLEYTRLKPDFLSWWFSKMQSDTLQERYAIKFCFKLGKKYHKNVWNASDCFWSILHESSISFWVA